MHNLAGFCIGHIHDDGAGIGVGSADDVKAGTTEGKGGLCSVVIVHGSLCCLTQRVGGALCVSGVIAVDIVGIDDGIEGIVDIVGTVFILSDFLLLGNRPAGYAVLDPAIVLPLFGAEIHEVIFVVDGSCGDDSHSAIVEAVIAGQLGIGIQD